MKTGNSKSAAISNANLGSEAKPWLDADQARNIMSAADYKHMDRPYAPACGSCAVFVQSEKFAGIHDGKPDDIGIYGQENHRITPPLAIMNLAITAIEADFRPEHGDTSLPRPHPDLGSGYVLANVSMSPNHPDEGDIPRDHIEAELGECTVTIPGQHFTASGSESATGFLGKASPFRSGAALQFREARWRSAFELMY